MPQSDFWPFANNNRKEGNIGIDDGNSLLLQKQLGAMEGEVKEIEMELAAIRRTRHDVKLSALSSVVEPEDKLKEAYPRLEEEKLENESQEISKLREDLIRAKNAEEEERFRRMKYETRLLDMEQKLNEICGAGKAPEHAKELQRNNGDEIISLKTQVRDLKDQIEEMKITDEEKSEQLQEYRIKYLQAQQNVEELQRQIDVMEFDNKQASDQIHMELHKMKMQFQEKLLELAPLPDLLKGAQIQLQEAKQLQKLAEDNTQQISDELHRFKEKLVATVNSLNQEKLEKCKLLEDNTAYKVELDEKDKQVDDLMKYIEDYKCKVLRLEEKHHQLELRYNEKVAENTALSKGLEELRDESTRTLSRVKERSESTRHYLQTQIAELERQMISCRAQCRSYQKERDEIRQRTQIQITSLKENFDLVEVRLRGLQRQIVLLKQCYSVVLPEDEDRTENDFIYSPKH